MKAIYSTLSAFAALKEDGTVAAWGDSTYGGSSVIASKLSGVSNIFGCTSYRSLSIYPDIYQLDENITPDPLPTFKPTSPSSQPSSPPSSPPSSHPTFEATSQPNTQQLSLSGAEIAGAIVGTLVGTSVICGVLFYFFWWVPRIKAKNTPSGAPEVQNPIQENNCATATHDV